MLTSFFTTEYPRLRAPRVVYVERGQRLATPCLDGSGGRGNATSQSYEYCPADRTIYVGQDLLWTFYRMGDAAPVIGLAHEWGHHIQFIVGVPSPRTLAQSVNFENQADCVAGAWARYARDRGWLEAPDDLDDVGVLLRAIGTRETAGRDHGTATERRTAFDLGLGSGLEGCNRYAERTPIG
jgi:predicted metalloprotease